MKTIAIRELYALHRVMTQIKVCHEDDNDNNTADGKLECLFLFLPAMLV